MVARLFGRQGSQKPGQPNLRVVRIFGDAAMSDEERMDPKEFERLVGKWTDDYHKLELLKSFSNKYECVVVLKGAFTVIAAPDGRTAIIPVATPALARAGTGDVLAGLIAGLRAQGMDAFDAAAAGAWIHAQAGLHAADVMGSTATVLAGDVLDAVVDVIADLS